MKKEANLTQTTTENFSSMFQQLLQKEHKLTSPPPMLAFLDKAFEPTVDLGRTPCNDSKRRIGVMTTQIACGLCACGLMNGCSSNYIRVNGELHRLKY